REAKEAFDKGYREVTLLGQNVNSYSWSQSERKTGIDDTSSGQTHLKNDDPTPGRTHLKIEEQIYHSPAGITGTSEVSFVNNITAQNPGWSSVESGSESSLSQGKSRPVGFAELLEMVASIDPLLRVRYSTSHPKDL